MVTYDLYKIKLLLLWLVVGTSGHVQVYNWIQYTTQHKHSDPSTMNGSMHYRPEYIVPQD